MPTIKSKEAEKNKRIRKSYSIQQKCIDAVAKKSETSDLSESHIVNMAIKKHLGIK